jgi:hypothetical protein
MTCGGPPPPLCAWRCVKKQLCTTEQCTACSTPSPNERPTNDAPRVWAFSVQRAATARCPIWPTALRRRGMHTHPLIRNFRAATAAVGDGRPDRNSTVLLDSPVPPSIEREEIGMLPTRTHSSGAAPSRMYAPILNPVLFIQHVLLTASSGNTSVTSPMLQRVPRRAGAAAARAAAPGGQAPLTALVQ